jgi:hypothetical protein
MHRVLRRFFVLFIAVVTASGLALSSFAQSASDSTKAPAPAKPKAAAKAKTGGTKSSGVTKGSSSLSTFDKPSKKVTKPKGTDAPPPGQIHTLDQIVEIIKNSKLFYSVESLAVITPGEHLGDTARPILNADQYMKMVDSQPTLSNFKLSSIGVPLFEMAAAAVKDSDYPTAILRYHQVLQSDPSFTPAMSHMGEIFLKMGALDSAAFYLTGAVLKNPVDYMSHKLLGEVYWNQEKRPEAIKEMTTAHVLNLNDKAIPGRLEEWRLLTGRLWNGRPLVPLYRIAKVADTVYVRAPIDWIGYAMVKAVWKYEPGYAEKMLGYDPKGSIYVMMQEKEALVGAMTTNKHLENIHAIVEQGYVDEFILYEVVGPQHPMNIAVLPKEEIDRLVEYVDKFR